MLVRAGFVLTAAVVLIIWLSFQETKTSAREPQTTFTVTTTADESGACDASCSLREAITAANNS